MIARQLIAVGEDYPTSALSVLAGLPENPGADVLAEIRALDKRLDGKTGEPIARLRVGIAAVLGRSGEEESLKYLRELYIHAARRRAPVAMSLTQHPEGENWAILVDSLRTVDGEPAREILRRCAKSIAGRRNRSRIATRFCSGCGCKTNGGELVAQLLEKWVGQTPYAGECTAQQQLAAWQAWYATTFPNERPAELPKRVASNKWSYEELLAYLESPEGKAGSPSRGARCSKTPSA